MLGTVGGRVTSKKVRAAGCAPDGPAPLVGGVPPLAAAGSFGVSIARKPSPSPARQSSRSLAEKSSAFCRSISAAADVGTISSAT